MKIQSLKMPFQAKSTLQVAMPMGGIGAGCICLNGSGGLVDFSIRNRPATTARQDGHVFTDAAFGVLHIKGNMPVTRLLEGPLHPEEIYDRGLKAQGFRQGGQEGLPRFAKSNFASAYPFGRVSLTDPSVPLQVEITGFNPLIPLDDKNSGIPCAILEYSFRNTSREKVAYEFSYHLSHLAVGAGGDQGTRTKALSRGVYFYNTDDVGSEQFGSACLIALAGKPLVKGMWFRGGWFDSITQLWTELSSGTFKPNSGSNSVDIDGRNGGSILFRGALRPGEKIVHPLAISWHFPNVHYGMGGVHDTWPPKKTTRPSKTRWKPFYNSLWKDAGEVAQHVFKNYPSLRQRSSNFSQALLSSSLPKEVLDAVMANLAILKSPTILRQENGNVWAWEGCFADWGCCYGSCTHVWNYAQSMPQLFPGLERTLREQELLRSLNTKGHANFRSALPDGPPRHDFHAAADGQLGGILKLYREWQISGDTSWMKSLYPQAKKSLEYCIRTWDPGRSGALFEPHHNTYDIEFWGPDGMCTSIYIGALSAAAAMAKVAGKARDEKSYRELASRGACFMEENLFNGEYYYQRVQYQDLKDQSFVKMLSTPPALDGQVKSLLRIEGPKYQYGSGCLSDGVIGAWMARLYGVTTPMNPRQIRSTLEAIYAYNFRHDLSVHANCQRPGYAFGKEGGLLLCSWPHGGKPVLPFVYSDEVWTGIEYQVASHLIEEGLVQKGLDLVRAVRERYDGRARNPFNEYECGSYYARAMASYALLLSLSGFRYSAVEQTMYLSPKLNKTPFQVFFSTAKAWGTLTLKKDRLLVSVTEGKLSLKKIHLTISGKSLELQINQVVKAGSPAQFLIPKKN